MPREWYLEMNAAIHMASTEKLITVVSRFPLSASEGLKSEGLKITRLFSYLLGEGMAGKAEGKADGPPGDASTCAGSGAESLEVPECDG